MIKLFIAVGYLIAIGVVAWFAHRKVEKENAEFLRKEMERITKR